MKRIIIVSILLPCMLLVSVLCMWRIKNSCDYVARTAYDILEASEAGDGERVLSATSLLTEFWRKEESILVLFVRHGFVEEMDHCIARLNSLAEEGDRASLHGELEVLLWEVEGLRRSEAFSIINIF